MHVKFCGAFIAFLALPSLAVAQTSPYDEPIAAVRAGEYEAAKAALEAMPSTPCDWKRDYLLAKAQYELGNVGETSRDALATLRCGFSLPEPYLSGAKSLLQWSVESAYRDDIKITYTEGGETRDVSLMGYEQEAAERTATIRAQFMNEIRKYLPDIDVLLARQRILDASRSPFDELACVPGYEGVGGGDCPEPIAAPVAPLPASGSGDFD